MSSLFKIILTYSGYILSYPKLYLTDVKGNKKINRGAYIVVFDIRSLYTINICISNTSAMRTWIGCISIGDACIGYICARGAFVKNVEPRALVESGATLVSLNVNNFCFQLFIKLIFTSINN